MRTIGLVRKSVIVVASFVTLSMLSAPGATLAVTSSISPTPNLMWIVQGSFFDSSISLTSDIDSTQIDFQVTDNYVLHEGWLIRINDELIQVDQIVDPGHGHPDTLLVTRAVKGSVAAPHNAGAMLRTQAVTINVYANNITDAWGLGGFGIYMKLPPEVAYGQMIPQTAWLESTGRSSWCDGPVLIGTQWRTSCSTLGNDPPGPTGSGLIATVTLVPLQSSTGTRVVDFSASFLVNAPGNDIPATVRNFTVKIMKCPDTNLDNWVDSGDAGQIARNLSDQGEDSGATLLDALDSSQTNNIAISGLGTLVVGDTIGIDAEQMTIVALNGGPSMRVVRAVNGTRAASHAADTKIFRATVDGNRDGKKAYTDARDVNDDLYVDSGDYAVVARTMIIQCPAP